GPQGPLLAPRELYPFWSMARPGAQAPRCELPKFAGNVPKGKNTPNCHQVEQGHPHERKDSTVMSGLPFATYGQAKGPHDLWNVLSSRNVWIVSLGRPLGMNVLKGRRHLVGMDCCLMRPLVPL
ncbi:hypothetical protein GOODEAATRI_027369, partial [Goodea atripinnis]